MRARRGSEQQRKQEEQTHGRILLPVDSTVPSPCICPVLDMLLTVIAGCRPWVPNAGLGGISACGARKEARQRVHERQQRGGGARQQERSGDEARRGERKG